MASSKQVYTRIPNGGFNRSVEPHALKPDEWYDILNFRPEVGAMKQTAPIVQKQALTLLTDEAAVSQTKFLDIVRDASSNLKYLLVNHVTARHITPTTLSTQTLIPCVLQTAVPNNATVYGQCLLYGINATDFAAAADNIEITVQAGGATFKWRRNGGSWSSALAMGPAVAVGANGLYAAFMELTGYTVADTWKWTRMTSVPYDAAVTSTKDFPYSSASYMTDIYLGGIGRNVMRVRNGFITSVGYRRAYGKYVVIFENHLVIAHYAGGVYSAGTGVADAYVATTTPFNLGWSHLSDPDQFFSTLANEADEYTIPYNSSPDGVNFGITGMALLNGSNWIYVSDAIAEQIYLGLPNVMQTKVKFNGVGCAFPSGLVNTKRGHYFISKDNFYFFDGIQPQAIGEPVRKKFFGEVVPPTDANYEKLYGFYDSSRQEVSWTYWTLVGTYYQVKQVVFQEKYNRWYFRNLPGIDTAATNLTVCSRIYNTPDKLAFGGSGFLYFEYDTTETLANTVYDAVSVAGATTYTQPLLVTPDLFYEDLFYSKEADGLFLDAGWLSGVTGVTISHSIRKLIVDTVTMTDCTQLWISTLGATASGVPRVGGRVFRFQFKFTGTKPLSCILAGWGDRVYKKDAER